MAALTTVFCVTASTMHGAYRLSRSAVSPGVSRGRGPCTDVLAPVGCMDFRLRSRIRRVPGTERQGEGVRDVDAATEHTHTRVYA